MDTADKILNNLRRQCSRREYCTADVLKKAEKALDGDHQQAVKVLNVLVEEKFVDDRRYATAFARDKSTIAGWGAVKIRYMLSAKGISKDIISEALEEVDDKDRYRSALTQHTKHICCASILRAVLANIYAIIFLSNPYGTRYRAE